MRTKKKDLGFGRNLTTALTVIMRKLTEDERGAFLSKLDGENYTQLGSRMKMSRSTVHKLVSNVWETIDDNLDEFGTWISEYTQLLSRYCDDDSWSLVQLCTGDGNTKQGCQHERMVKKKDLILTLDPRNPKDVADHSKGYIAFYCKLCGAYTDVRNIDYLIPQTIVEEVETSVPLHMPKRYTRKKKLR